MTSLHWLRKRPHTTSRQRRSRIEHLENRQLLTTVMVDTAADVVDIGKHATFADLPGPDNLISLREALLVSNNVPGADVIVFDTAGAFASSATIHLTKGQLRIRDSITIEGPGARHLSLDAGGQSRTMLITDGDAARRSNVVLRNLTLTGGSTTRNGGSVQNLDENLTLENSLVSGNQSERRGGGIYHRGGQLIVLNSTIANNVALSGGGIWTKTGPTAQNSQITNSTLSGNRASQRGGGLENFRGITLIHNSTITNNEAPLGGGIVSKGQVGTETRLGSTIVSGNLASDLDIVAGIVDSFFSSGSNLIGQGNATARFTDSDQLGVRDPGLAPLRENQAGTPTHALLPDSRALDQGANLLGLASDQRGLPFTRAAGLGVDVGAFELQALVGPFIVDIQDDEDDGNYAPGDLSLREAIALANSNPGEDEILFNSRVFNTPQIISLQTGSLEVTDEMTLLGPGADLLTIQGQALWPVFTINDGLRSPELEVSLTGAAVVGGKMGLVGQGHLTLERMTVAANVETGVDIDGTLTVRQSAVRNNGGAGLLMRDEFGNVEVSSSTIADNQDAGIHGGTYGRVDVGNSTITGNSGTGITGPGYAGRYAGFVTVSESTIALNTGGGINGSNISIERSVIQENSGLGGVRSVDGQLTINESTISGNSTHLSGGGVTFSSSSAYIQNRLTITSSDIAENHSDRDGGGIFVHLGAGRNPLATYASVNISTSTITENRATGQGGGIAIRSNVETFGGAVTAELTGSVVSGNEAGAAGGGIAHQAGGSNDKSQMTIGHSTLADNRAGKRETGHGGGIYSTARLHVEGSLISGNLTSDGSAGDWNASCNPTYYCEYSYYNGADAGNGGGLFSAGMTSITNSAIVNNMTGDGGAGGQGGDGGSGAGVFATGAPLTVRNSTISGNTTGEGGEGKPHQFCHYTLPYSGIFSYCDVTPGSDGNNGVGGGIRSLAPLDVAFSTLTENSSGVALAAAADVRSTIISGNLEEDVHQDGGAWRSLGFNLIGRGNAEGSFGNNDLVGILDPLLGALADNGGPTPSHKPLQSSPAVNAGDPLPVAAPAYDQRGERFARIVEQRIDIGSIELQETGPVINFEEADVSSLGTNQDGDGTVSVEDGGASLRIVGNAWKKIDLDYEITSNTILEFDFQSMQQGEIHGIGLDNDNFISANRTFRLYGSQSFGMGDYDDYAPVAPMKKHYRIAIGEFYQGQVSYLFFVNDHDARPGDAESLFSHVRLYEVVPGSTSLMPS